MGGSLRDRPRRHPSDVSCGFGFFDDRPPQAGNTNRDDIHYRQLQRADRSAYCWCVADGVERSIPRRTAFRWQQLGSRDCLPSTCERGEEKENSRCVLGEGVSKSGGSKVDVQNREPGSKRVRWELRSLSWQRWATRHVPKQSERVRSGNGELKSPIVAAFSGFHDP